MHRSWDDNVCTLTHHACSSFPSDLGKFEESLTDLYVKSTEGNVAVIPCRPPTGNPPTVTAFDINGSRVQLESGEVFHDYQINYLFGVPCYSLLPLLPVSLSREYCRGTTTDIDDKFPPSLANLCRSLTAVEAVWTLLDTSSHPFFCLLGSSHFPWPG